MIRRFVTMSESIDIKAGVKSILERIETVKSKRPEKVKIEFSNFLILKFDKKIIFQFKNPIQLVAVSKTKPVEDILEAYNVGQRHFGENYIQELEEKSNDPKILENCKDIKWHFIGHLQTNKVKKLAKIPNLHMVQTIHSEKLADILNKLWEKEKLETDGKLKVLVQVNTSGEDEKNGVEPDKALEVYEFINEKCKALQCEGLMTIGAFGFDYSKGPNPDFVALMECLDHFPNSEAMQVSFGMSDDFEQAVIFRRNEMWAIIINKLKIFFIFHTDSNGQYNRPCWKLHFRSSGEETVKN